ncbi:glycosyltransferase family 39 protein [Nocardioides bigeumensis]|uniref:Glycosyltransferase family 39 protein n=1 Tax=Nocardioides bigeumensis TaxID=433657 RepID=A0ABN2XXE5_9ACTN
MTPPPFARKLVLAAAGVVAFVLTAASPRYGYHRDELYFRMLEPAWGYVDQPPLVPLIAGALGDHLVLMRAPATIAAACSVVLVGLLVRELGGSSRAQAWGAWTYAGTTVCLNFGHVLLTSAFDLVAWPLICLCVVRAELRDRPRWWLVAGVVAGLASYNRLLVALLLVGIALGLLLHGPRRRLLSPHVLGGALVALVLALPNVLYQAGHDWPQLAMGEALAENNASDVRVFMWVLLVVGLGPPMAYVWVRGLVALWRRPDWAPVRFLAPAFVLVVVFTFVSGAQPHYPLFPLIAVFAAGVVVVHPGVHRWRWVWAPLVLVNVWVAAVVSLPVLPVDVVGRTPVPAMNMVIADQVGWPTYVDQVRAVASSVAQEQPVVITSNYGEAGAIDRFASELPVFSGQNAIFDRARPPDSAGTVVMVGFQYAAVRDLFGSCEIVDELDNGVGVDNEEQGAPVAVCRAPVAPWSELWPEFRHLD